MRQYCDVFYIPHEAQMEIHQARDRRFRTVCTGRRFGKTLCLAAELLECGSLVRGGDYGWIAPTYNVAERGIEAFRAISRDGYVKLVGRAPCRAEFESERGPVRVWFLSADNADAIRGYGFQGLVIDEAASIPVDVWNYVLRPTISQTLGWAIFVSTPKGRNWFYDMFTRGLDPEERDYVSFRFPSTESPFFPMAEWDEARRTLPAVVFRQEYEAEFLEDSAGVFRGIEACLLADDAGAAEYHRSVVIGCDVAKHTDWTVLVAMDAATGKCFAWERFNHLEWPIQKERIVAFARRWRGRVILDSTGVGDAILDDLRRVFPDVEGYVLTAASKVDLVQRLIVAIEQQAVAWPAAWEILTNELKRFEYEIGPTGRISYAAPSGFHDDCVMALALANHGRWAAGTAGTMARLPGGGREVWGKRRRGRPRCI